MRLLRSYNKNEDSRFDRIGYSIINKARLKKTAKVTVVIPVYNPGKYLKNTVDSVIQQDIGFSKVTLILIDDNSTDGSREVCKEYSRRHKNIVSVFLEKNTGTPAYPRNLGIHLANSKYITFLDADDYLAPSGLKALYSLLQKTRGSYATGKTVRVGSKKQSVSDIYESNRIRHNASPFSIRHFFHRLGPTARMMRLKTIRKNNIWFPEMKFAEDKQFFIDAVLAAGKISTTTATVYYVNRVDENSSSLVRRTGILEKMDYNIAVLRYVLEKGLEAEKEKAIVSRLIEFDAIARLFDRRRFGRSKNKQDYYKKFEEFMSVFHSYGRDYAPEEIIIEPINRIYYELVTSSDFETLEQLSSWSTSKGEFYYTEKNGLPYKVACLKNGAEVEIPVVFEARIEKEKEESDSIEFEIALTGHSIPTIEGLLLQSRKKVERSYQISDCFEQKGNILKLRLDRDNFQSIRRGSYIMYLQYNDYEKAVIEKSTSDRRSFMLRKRRKLITYRTARGTLSMRVRRINDQAKA